MNTLIIPPMPKWPYLFVKIVSFITIIGSISMLLGWIFYSWLSKDELQLLVSIKPNVAICFLLSGIALWIYSEKSCSTYMKNLSQICGAIIFLISFLTLLEYFFQINLGIDQGIFSQPIIDTTTEFLSPNGRMSPFIAANFTLTGFIFIFLDSKTISFRVHHILISIIMLFLFFEFLVRLYKVGNAHTALLAADIYSKMALPTLCTFILLELGILFSRPTLGIAAIITSTDNGGTLARRLIPPAIILPILLGYIGLSAHWENLPEAEVRISILVMGIIFVLATFILLHAYFVEHIEIERRKAEQALKLNQEQLQSILDNTNMVIYINDLEGRYVLVNKQFEKLFHKNLNEVIGKTIHEVLPKKLADELVTNNLSIIKSKSPTIVEKTIQDNNIYYLYNTFPLLNTDGIPYAIGSIATDITELKYSKEQAEKLAEEAKQANNAKGAFLATMSHEIRTPLNGVIGMTGLLFDTPLSAEQHDYVDTIRISGEALLTVINDILDFSKIESGRMELEKMDFNIHTLVNEAVEVLAVQIQNKSIAVGAYIENDVPEWVMGDPARVRQVLNNLLSNAAKFTEKGEISVRVKILSKQDQQITLLFEVIDTGIGIAPSICNNLFQPFAQGDVSTSRKYGGSGLGLVICKRLVERMGGTIRIDSALGWGSKFEFTIQFTEASAPAHQIEYAPIPELLNARILCVDDNAINREVIQHQLESWQLRCDVAINAGEALSLLEKATADQDPYLLALIDYGMPGMNGIELVQIMHKLKEIAETPVVILSSLGATFNTIELKKLGIQTSLSKPMHPVRLYETIINVLTKMPENRRILTTTPLPHAEEMQNIRVLLVEDNIINQRVALRILSKLGYRGDVANNGLEALQAIQRIPYDVILMDCQMPEMDGYTATEKIRDLELQQQTYSPMIIIAMTAHALASDREKCLACGMNDYITKPIDIPTLDATLKKWLEKKSHHGIKQDIKMIQSTPTTPAPSSSIDIQRIQDIFGDDKATIQEFIKTLIASLSTLLEDIKGAMKKNDAALAKDLFHRLKGSAGNSGIMKLHKLCITAEQNVLQADWKAVDASYQAVTAEFEQFKKEAVEKFNITL